MKSTIGRKISLAFLALLILIVMIVVITFHGFNTFTDSLNNMEYEAVKRGASGNLRFSITQLLMTGNDYIITEKDYYKREYNRWNLNVDDFYKQFIQLHLTDEELQLTEKIKQDIDSIRTISAKIFPIQHPRQSPEAWALMEMMDYRFGEDVNMKTTQIFDGISRRVEENRIQVSADKESVANTMYIVTFFAVFISFLISYLTVQRISKPIITITKAAKGIANGDYSLRPIVNTHDEVAVLAEAFSSMAGSIQKSQKALEESKRLTETIVATVPVGLMVYDSSGKILSVNNSFCNFFGLFQNLPPYQNISSLFKELTVTEACIDHILTCKPVQNVECCFSDAKKGTRIFNLIILPLKLNDGESLLMLQDITDQKKAEEELLKIGTAVEQTADCVVITDKNGIIQYVNTAFTKITGYSKEEALGKTQRILKSNLHPQEFYKTLWKTIQSGEVFSETFLNRRKDGELIYEIKTITPIKDKEGNITHFVSTAKEITEQKRAEQEIISQKDRFAQLFENSPIAIALLDDQDKVVNINESFSALFGYYVEEIREKSLTDLIVPPELKEEAKLYSDQTIGGSQICKESYRIGKDGTLVYVQIVGVPVIVNDKTVGIYGMYVDLTQRKDAEEKMKLAKKLAEQSDKLKSEFLAQMSHEIRTPINIMAGNVDYLKDLFSGKTDSNTRDCFEGIDLASKRIIRTVDLILNVAELQTSGYKSQFVKVDLNFEILNKLYKEHQFLAKQKGLELIYKCEVKESKVLADVYSITQIFANLIDNAIKYTKKGKVEILLGKNKPGNIMVEIKDTGIGMSKEFLPRIFEPFVQEDHGYTRSYDGSGLGLALTKKYCEINNATIEVESEKNVGSTFRVTFNN